jgi:DNA-binding MarR family transcriptional regulator
VGQRRSTKEKTAVSAEPFQASNARAEVQLAQLRKAVSARLPSYDSLVGLEICLAIGEYHLSGRHLSITALQNEIARSPGAVRRIVQSMARDGWVRVERQPDDGRGRLIKPTAKLTESFDQFLG